MGKGSLCALAGLMTVVSSSCYASVPGDILRTEIDRGSEAVVGATYSVRAETRPTPERPQVRVRVDRLEDLTYDEVDIHEELRRPRMFVAGAGAVLSLGIGIAAHSAIDTTKSEGKTLRDVGIAVSLIGVLGATRIMISEPERAGGVIEGRRRLATTSRTVGPQGTEELRVIIDRDTVSHRVPRTGRVIVDITRQLEEGYFFEPRSLFVTYELLGAGATAEVTYHISEWASSCVRTGARGAVFAQPTSGSARIGEFDSGNVYRLISEETTDWYEISYRGQPGWIPRLAAERCWFVSEGDA